MRLKLLTFVPVAAAIAIACDSETIISTGGGFASGSIPGAIPTEEATPPGPPNIDRCPSTPPTDDSSCVGSTGTCDYGVDFRNECNMQAYCNGSRWRVTPPSCQVVCPKSRADVVPGTECDDDTMTCSWLEGTCGCVGPKTDGGAPFDAGSDSGEDGGSEAGASLRKGTWACAPPPTEETLCPLSAPKPGTTCVKSVTCDYGTCILERDVTFVCSGRVWSRTISKGKCPP